MYDLTAFNLKDMTECGAAIRKLGAGATCLEEVANRIVRHLYGHLGDKQEGNRACVLVRFFMTHPFRTLDPDSRRFVLNLLGEQRPSPVLRCFTLLATAGEQPEWNDRTQSRGFKAIPLTEGAFPGRFPMFLHLLTQFGVKLRARSTCRLEFVTTPRSAAFSVFHVPEAAENACVPCQQEFVIPFGVRSVLGFGGPLPSGEIFAVILFAKVPIPRETAELFKTIALCARIAVLSYDGRSVFAHVKRGWRGRKHETQGRRHRD